MPHLEISARPLRWLPQEPFLFAASITENIYLRARRNFRSSGAPGGDRPPASMIFIMTLPQCYRHGDSGRREGSVAGPEAANLHCPRAGWQPEHHDPGRSDSISGRYQRTSHQNGDRGFAGRVTFVGNRPSRRAVVRMWITSSRCRWVKFLFEGHPSQIDANSQRTVAFRCFPRCCSKRAMLTQQ